jgi:hypothetical protein
LRAEVHRNLKPHRGKFEARRAPAFFFLHFHWNRTPSRGS